MTVSKLIKILQKEKPESIVEILEDKLVVKDFDKLYWVTINLDLQQTLP